MKMGLYIKPLVPSIHLASDEQIHSFEQKTGLLLPDDYKEFLKITNGCRLFDNLESGEKMIYTAWMILLITHMKTPTKDVIRLPASIKIIS